MQTKFNTEFYCKQKNGKYSDQVSTSHFNYVLNHTILLRWQKCLVIYTEWTNWNKYLPTSSYLWNICSRFLCQSHIIHHQITTVYRHDVSSLAWTQLLFYLLVFTLHWPLVFDYCTKSELLSPICVSISKEILSSKSYCSAL